MGIRNCLSILTDFVPVGKWRRMFRIIRLNGGIFKSGYKLWRFDTLKEGRYVGCDANTNKYYMNDNYIIGRSRWVEYNIKYRWDYDATHTYELYGSILFIVAGNNYLMMEAIKLVTRFSMGRPEMLKGELAKRSYWLLIHIVFELIPKITSEWYGWLHYKTDKLPSEDSVKHTLLCSRQAQTWLQPFEENMTGTNKAYYPYSTTKPKIKIWDVAAYAFHFRGGLRRLWESIATPQEIATHGLETPELDNTGCRLVCVTKGSHVIRNRVLKGLLCANDSNKMLIFMAVR